MGIIRIYEPLIESHDMGTAGHLRDNGRKWTDPGLLDDPGFEYTPDDTLVDELLIELYLALGM